MNGNFKTYALFLGISGQIRLVPYDHARGSTLYNHNYGARSIQNQMSHGTSPRKVSKKASRPRNSLSQYQNAAFDLNEG